MADRSTEPLAPALAGSTGGAGASSMSGRVRRRYSLLTRRDKLVLGLMVGVPLFFDLALVWGPAIVSVFLSFTNWNGIGSPFDAKVIGLKNYENLIGSYPFFWPAVQHNFLWLAWLMFIATPIGMFLAVLLDREDPGHADLPDRLLHPGRALARGHRHHLAAPVRARAGLHQQRPGPDRRTTT